MMNGESDAALTRCAAIASQSTSPAGRGFRFALLLVLASCANDGPPRTYQANDAELAVANAARMACSCVFVMNMPEDFCKAWVKASPDVARFSVDRGSK